MSARGCHGNRRRPHHANLCSAGEPQLSASEETRAKVTDYIAKLIEAGEKDMDRLTVCGLTYLRELDGSNDPVKAGFTGL